MTGELLHAFFFWMPAVIVVGYGLSMKTPVARAMLIGGRGVFAVLMGLAVLGMFFCDGKVFDGYSACLGGEARDNVSIVVARAGYDHA